jgi:hypothetical protein
MTVVLGKLDSSTLGSKLQKKAIVNKTSGSEWVHLLAEAS